MFGNAIIVLIAHISKISETRAEIPTVPQD